MSDMPKKIYCDPLDEKNLFYEQKKGKRFIEYTRSDIQRPTVPDAPVPDDLRQSHAELLVALKEALECGISAYSEERTAKAFYAAQQAVSNAEKVKP